MTDCLIVGAGVIGLSLAYACAQRGLRVRVVDQGFSGREASWAGAGILPPANRETALDPLDQLRGLSHQLHPQWAQQLRAETGLDTGYRRCGGIYLACSRGEAAALHGLALEFGEQDIEFARLSVEFLIEVEPALRPLAEAGRIQAAYRAPQEAQLRNPDHLRALRAACLRRQVEIEEQNGLQQIVTGRGQIDGFVTTHGLRQAARYCIATGAWTHRVLQMIGVASGILPVRGQMVMFACSAPLFCHVLNQGPRYLVPRDDGRVLVGSTEEEVGFDKGTTAVACDELCRLAYTLVPQLAEAEIERSWAGLRPGTFDGLPYLGAVPGYDNLFVAAGHFRSGLHLSPATAVVMAELLSGETPCVDLTPFRLSRG